MAEINSNTKSIDKLTSKTKSKRKVFKFVMYGILVLAVIGVVSHLIWNASGSGRWELAMDKNGVKVWTLKTPGSNLIMVKGRVVIESKLAGMVKLLEDLESCVDADCYDANVIEPIETLPGHYAAFITFKFDIPGFSTREYVLFQRHYQDPVSKKLDIHLISAPNKVPRDECCVRVTHLHNTWRIVPLENGKLDIEFVQDTDIGGMPYLLANLALTYGTYEVLKSMQDLMNMEKYRNARVDYIEESGSNEL